MTTCEPLPAVRSDPPLVVPTGRWTLRSTNHAAVVRMTWGAHECTVNVPGVTANLERTADTLVLTVVLPLAHVLCSAPGHPFPDQHPLPPGAPSLVLVAARCVLTATHLVAPAVATAGSTARTVELSGPLRRAADGALHIDLAATVRQGPLAPPGAHATIALRGVLELLA